jgi:hypothetical protein
MLNTIILQLIHVPSFFCYILVLRQNFVNFTRTDYKILIFLPLSPEEVGLQVWPTIPGLLSNSYLSSTRCPLRVSMG